MNYENMSLDELKEHAKQLDIKVGNIGKEKLIEKIKAVENNKTAISAVIEDNDLEAVDLVPAIMPQEEKKESLLDSITSAIDDLDESVDIGINSNIEDLPIDTVIPVKSITFGGLTYKSRTNNAIFRCLKEQFLIEFRARKNSGKVTGKGVHFRCFYAYAPIFRGSDTSAANRRALRPRSALPHTEATPPAWVSSQRGVSFPIAPAFPGQGHSFRPQCGPR